MEPVPLYPAEAGDDLLGRVWELRYTCQRLAAPDEPAPSRSDTLGYLRHPPRSTRRWHWIVGDVDGYAHISIREDSPSAYLELVVAPGARRRGIGHALLAAAAEQAREAGGRYLVGSHLDPAGAGFTRAVGAREGTGRMRTSVLTLPLASPPVPDVSGYTRVSWTGPAPEHLLDSYASARNAINDSPHDEAIADERYTPELVRDLEESVARRDRELRVTVAVDGAGTVAGYTEIRVGRDAGATGFTEDTAVVAAHRGRHLALWIKDGNLRQLAAERPDVRHVVTENDVTNAPMLAVNARLGFVGTSVWTEAILDLG